MTDQEVKTTVGKKNMAMQAELAELFGEKQPFSAKGLKYLANRMLGTKYRKPLIAALTAMCENRLQEIISEELKSKTKTAFAFTTDIPDAAYIIIGTGRRAVKGEHGWSEGNESLLKLDPIPNNLDKLSAKEKDRLLKIVIKQEAQQEVCLEIMQVFVDNAPQEEPKPVVEKTVKPKVEKVKTAQVIQLHKEPPVIPPSEIVIEDVVVEAVQEAITDVEEIKVVEPAPAEPAKKSKPRTKKSKKPEQQPAA